MDFKQAIADYQAEHLLNAAIYISKNDELIFQDNLGFSDIETKREFTIDTPFPIASLTKQFTASAILLLQKDGELKLDEPIINYLTNTHTIWQGKVPDWAHQVTPHHLLTHSSGIANYTYEKWSNVDHDVMAAIMNRIKDKPLAFSIGTKASYNNTGYLILSAIIDELSPEKNMAKFLENRIFAPLKMTNSFLPDIAWEMSYIDNFNVNPEFPIHYVANIDDPQAKLIPVTKSNPRAPYFGGAAIISSATDLLKWNEALYSGKILSQESVKVITTPYIEYNSSTVGKVKCGYGIMVNNTIGETIYMHGGWILGIRTELSYNPKNKVTVLIMSNLSPDETQSDEIQSAQAKSLVDLGFKLQKIARSM